MPAHTLQDSTSDSATRDRCANTHFIRRKLQLCEPGQARLHTRLALTGRPSIALVALRSGESVCGRSVSQCRDSSEIQKARLDFSLRIVCPLTADVQDSTLQHILLQSMSFTWVCWDTLLNHTVSDSTLGRSAEILCVRQHLASCNLMSLVYHSSFKADSRKPCHAIQTLQGETLWQDAILRESQTAHGQHRFR